MWGARKTRAEERALEDKASTRSPPQSAKDSVKIFSIVEARKSASLSENGMGGLILITLWKGPSVPSRIP